MGPGLLEAHMAVLQGGDGGHRRGLRAEQGLLLPVPLAQARSQGLARGMGRCPRHGEEYEAALMGDDQEGATGSDRAGEARLKNMSRIRLLPAPSRQHLPQGAKDAPAGGRHLRLDLLMQPA